jgi:oligopeptide transport system ATP-binding protein
MPNNVLTVKGLKTQFSIRDGVVYAVDDLSFEVNAGEMVGIVGESGCGKSTAALSILRLIPHPGKIVAGQIILNGQDIVPLSESAMRKLRGPSVAMIFQDALAALDPTMRIGAQLMEPLRTHLGMSEVRARAQAIELLERVGIPAPATRLNNYSYQFSGGMRQRVMIALALSCNPQLLLADEPTTALDVTIQRQILDLIVTLRAETGAGVILITHDVGVVAETCDRVVVMYAGKVVETGKTQDVFVNPNHPYTRGLLTATLGLEHAKDRSLPTIPGMPPDLIDLPPGCSFAPRCPERAAGVCKEEMPALVDVGGGHLVSCWLPRGQHTSEVMQNGN